MARASLLTVVAVAVGLAALGVGAFAAARSYQPDRLADSTILVGPHDLLTGSQALLIGCEPHQAALVQQRDDTLTAHCISTPVAGRYQYQLVSSPALASMPVVVDAAPSVVERPVYRPRSVRRGRSWRKTALVIGGSTVTGAGVGGLIGGRKGALIGAAIGGGGSSIYEASKR